MLRDCYFRFGPVCRRKTKRLTVFLSQFIYSTAYNTDVINQITNILNQYVLTRLPSKFFFGAKKCAL